MYKIELSPKAEAVYRRLFERDRFLFDRMRAALGAIAEEPLEGKPLKGSLRGTRSWRIGQYRIIYRVEDKRLVVLILDMGHRGDIYR